MTHKKRIIIISSVSAAVVIGMVFLILGLTIWRPKTTQEWLNDFKSSLAFNIENHNQKTEKNISITENEIEVASFYQLVEIKEQEQGTVAHILIKENYPTLETDEFNIFDEYYFLNGTMHMYRKSGGEEVVTDFASTWEVFWEIANENAGSAEYNFAENIFENLEILHEDNLHKMSANIRMGIKRCLWEKSLTLRKC